jgi:hypothetical protein
VSPFFLGLSLLGVATPWGRLAAVPCVAQTLETSGALTPQAVALYPDEHRRLMTSEDYRRYTGAGILFCRDSEGVPQKAAAAWLIGRPDLVMMNAHNFRDRSGATVRAISDCYFQIGGRNYEFDPDRLRWGSDASRPLHITDDWTLARLSASVAGGIVPQPLPRAEDIPTGPASINVTMVSPAGHANFKGMTSIESCHIHMVDPPSEDGIRRVRHDCNDGFGGSGSGLFDEAGHLLAMQSASLDMNRRLTFDPATHYGSALLLEGELREAIRETMEARP